MSTCATLIVSLVRQVFMLVCCAVFCVRSRHVARQVTMNGVDFSSGGNGTFEFRGVTVISLVSPSTGPATGGTTITLSGSNFVDSASMECRIGRISVEAQVLNSSVITCVSPGGSEGEVAPIFLSTNGVDQVSSAFLARKQSRTCHNRCQCAMHGAHNLLTQSSHSQVQLPLRITPFSRSRMFIQAMVQGAVAQSLHW